MGRIAITGAGGRMGRALIDAISLSDGAHLSAALEHPPLSAKVREISAQVFQISRDAIKLAMQGEPATATVRLLSAGRATLNSKLISTAVILTIV